MPSKTKKVTTEMKESIRTMPNNIKMEQSVLSCVIGGSEEIKTNIISALSVEDFYTEANQIIYSLMAEMYKHGKPIDYMSLFDELMTSGHLEEVGGLDYITYLRTCTPGFSNYAYYMEIVKRDSVLRKIINMSKEIMEKAYVSTDKDECLAFAEKKVFDLAEKEEKSDFVHIKDASKTVMKNVIELAKNKGEVRGLKTGFYSLDKVINGFKGSNLIILAARPAVGKTSFAMNIVDNVGKMGKNVAVFSLEMSAEELAQRMLFSDSALSMKKVLNGEITPDDAKCFMLAAKGMEKKNIFIYDSSIVTPADIRAKCQQLKKKLGSLDLIMIDYLQLMSLDKKGAKNDTGRTQEISEMTRSLKVTCRELNVPILLLSQLNRAVEQRQDRPRMSDLRESGSIEQDADVIMFLHNPNEYEENKQRKSIQAMTGAEKERAERELEARTRFPEIELIIAKHRAGETKTLKLRFRKENTTFIDPDKDKNMKSLEENMPMPIGLKEQQERLKATKDEEKRFTENLD